MSSTFLFLDILGHVLQENSVDLHSPTLAKPASETAWTACRELSQSKNTDLSQRCSWEAVLKWERFYAFVCCMRCIFFFPLQPWYWCVDISAIIWDCYVSIQSICSSMPFTGCSLSRLEWVFNSSSATGVGSSLWAAPFTSHTVFFDALNYTIYGKKILYDSKKNIQLLFVVIIIFWVSSWYIV